MRDSRWNILLTATISAGIAFCLTRVTIDIAFCAVVVMFVLMSLAFVRFARGERRRNPALLLVITLLFVFLAVNLPPVIALDGAILIVAALVLHYRPPPSPRTVWLIVMVATLAALSAGAATAKFQARKLEAMRREYPIVSLESRLHYEKRKNAAASGSASEVHGSVARLLGEMEEKLSYSSDSSQFRLLHDQQYAAFARSLGFGIARMPRPSPRPLRRPALRDVQFCDTAVEIPKADARTWQPAIERRGTNGAEQLHEASRDDFSDPAFFGAVIGPPLKVSGFIEHGLHYPPTACLEDQNAWTIERLELVSLLKFDEPRVYVLDHLPRMDQLSADGVPTRPLDEFESAALPKLRGDEDVVVAHQGSEYRMLGSLRAAKQCLECHSVQRGELLGAFSYALRRNGPNGSE